MGRSLADFVVESGRASFLEGVRRLEGQPAADLTREWQVRLQPLRGRPFDAALTVAVLRHPAAEAAALHWSARDVSRRKALEESLRRSEARLLAILNTAFNGILLIDEGGTVESFNPAAERMFGYSAAEIVGRNVALLWPFSAEHARGPSPAGGEEAVREVVGRRRDGTTFPLEVSLGEVELDERRFLTAVVRDISRRRQVEEALRDRESQFESLVEVAECLIVIMRPDGTVLYFNPFAEKETGYAAGEVIGKNYLELFVPDPAVRDQVREAIGRALGGSPEQLEYVICCKAGLCHHVIWNTQRLAPVRGRRGRPHRRPGHHRREAGPGARAPGRAPRRHRRDGRRPGPRERQRPAAQPVLPGDALALRSQGQPESEALIAEIQKAQNHLHTLYEEVRTYAGPIDPRVPRLRPRRGLAAGVGRPGAPAAGEARGPEGADRGTGDDLRRRPLPHGAGLP